MTKESIFNVVPMTKEELKQERSSTTAENAWLDLQVDDRLFLPNGLATVVSIFEGSNYLEVGILYDTYITETHYDGQISHKEVFTTNCGGGFRRSVSGGYFSDRRRGDDGHFVTNTYKISSLKVQKKAVITEDPEKLYYIEEIEKLDDSLAYMHYVKKFDIKQLKTIYCMLKDFGGTVWKKDEYGEKFRIYVNNAFKFVDICKKDDTDWEINGLSTYQELKSKSNRAICEGLEQGILEISFYYDVIADEFHWETEPFKVCEKLLEKIKASVKELAENQKDAQKSEPTETLEPAETETEALEPFQIVEKSLDEATKIIKNTLNDIKNGYIQLGSVLSQVNKERLYKQKYKTFAEYCTTELDMKKSQAYSYIKVFDMYGASQEKLKNYSFTQLQLLADNRTSADEVVSEYPCSLSVRDLKKKLEEKNVQSTGQKENVHPTGQKCAVDCTKKISISSEENSILVKALELLQQQEENATIQNLLKKLKG